MPRLGVSRPRRRGRSAAITHPMDLAADRAARLTDRLADLSAADAFGV